MASLFATITWCSLLSLRVITTLVPASGPSAIVTLVNCVPEQKYTFMYTCKNILYYSHTRHHLYEVCINTWILIKTHKFCCRLLQDLGV